jgi:hypothetical protein
MNYQRIYDSMIERAMHRDKPEFVERHHIVPRCLGGSDDVSNLVDLTPEEHYVAHQLLVKIYPKHMGLAYAAIQMSIARPHRRNNKLYGWLRKEYSKRRKGIKLSEEHKAKVGAAHRGMKRPEGTGKKIGDSKRGKPRPESVRHAVSLGNKKRWENMSPEEYQQKCDVMKTVAKRGWETRRRNKEAA